MHEPEDDRPILVGVGESSPETVTLDWPSPTALAGAAIRAALEDSRRADLLRGRIDRVIALRSFRDSGVSHPFGGPENVPDAYARAADLPPGERVYADVGGHTPERHVHELLGQIQRGEVRAAVIVSAEALATARRAQRAGRELDWSLPSDAPFEDRYTRTPILSRHEFQHGVRSMILAYGLIENARRVTPSEPRAHARVRTPADHARSMAQLGAAFAEVARTRRHARFAQALTAADLERESESNYRVSDPYLRWHVAQDSVDLGAAVILTRVGIAKELGIPRDRWIHPLGAGDADAPPLSERARAHDSTATAHAAQTGATAKSTPGGVIEPELVPASGIARSPAFESALHDALERAELTSHELGPIDLYSCFPCVVSIGIDALGTPERPLGAYTCTGGLAFFGGPGNGYSLHALVALCERLRADPSRPGLLVANGGVLSKISVGVYAARPPAPAARVPAEIAIEVTRPLSVRAPQQAERATIESYTRPYRRGVAGPISALVRFADGRRSMAELEDPGDARELLLRRVSCAPQGERVCARLAE